MATCRYRLECLNGDSVIKQVKRYGMFWSDVENLSNKEHVLIKEILELEKKREDKIKEFKQAKKDRRKVVDEILARKVVSNKDFGFSFPFVDPKVSVFQGRKPDIPAPIPDEKPRVRVPSDGSKARQATATRYSTLDKQLAKEFGVDMTYQENQRRQQNKRKGGNSQNQQQNNQNN